MDTTVGIFASRDRAEEALVRLLQNHVPEYRIVYLTHSSDDAETVDRQVRAREPQNSDASPRTVETGTLGPAGSQVFALDFSGKPPSVHTPISNSNVFAALVATASSQDQDFFQHVLNEGHSVVIVRTNSAKAAATACEIFDSFALHMKRGGSAQTSVIFRRVPGGALAEFTGRIARTEGTSLLRESIQNFLVFGHKQILLDLERVVYLDSAGLGELVRSHATIRNHGGHLKIVRPSEGVLRLLQMTKLDQVFDIAADQSTAMRALRTSA